MTAAIRKVFSDSPEQFDPRKHLGALDFQVIDWDNMNFLVQEQRQTYERRQKQKGFWKEVVIPLVIIVMSALVSIIMIKFSYDYAVALKTGMIRKRMYEKIAINEHVFLIRNKDNCLIYIFESNLLYNYFGVFVF